MINWNRVSELRDEVGDEDFDEVVELFLAEVDTEIASLGSELDPAALASALHCLKGSALNLGFQKFAELCAAGEQRAAGGGPEEAEIEAIRQCYRASRAEFVAQLDHIRAA